ncbi:hypothetical protein BAY60_19970 [Prauserella muralis]|uniref:AB hydrolase-1 domain-containing protein n=2 Tax=Prauserella muralis TaxID=588067 RepID=A0A2V4AQB1_9PSEU|nr:hypothetical protein BAY60_19970 [Prauserella muralis]
MPYLRVGSGAPLVFLPGITAHHRQPEGSDLRAQLAQLRPLARHRQVWWINRRPGLAAPVTIAGLARDYAEALRHVRLDGPLDVVGVSTGGSIALQLAADHPALVRRLAVVSAACRLGPQGKRLQRRTCEWLRAGNPRRAAAAMLAGLGTRATTRRLLAGAGWLVGSRLLGTGDPDLLATLEAEDAFDGEPRLAAITAPALVAGGERDAFYGRDRFARTAELIPHGRLRIYPGLGHVSTHRRAVARDVLTFLDGG